MQTYEEDVHNLIIVDPYKMAVGSPAPGRAPRVPRASRARTAPPRPVDSCPDPQRFLRKNQRGRQPPVIDRREYQCVLEAPRPPLPKAVSPQPTQRSPKNFVKENVKTVENMEAKKPLPYTVVSCRGERRDMTLFLEGRKIIESESFGRVPKYLAARKKAWQRQKFQTTGTESDEDPKKMAARRDQDTSLTGYVQITDDERQTLLKGLKERWREVHKEFLLLPVLCDTVPKVKRKLRLEHQLSELEKDIELLERNPFIYLDKRPSQ